MKKKASAQKKSGENNTRLAGLKDYAVLLEPIITEKSSFVGQSGSRIVFKVPLKSTKSEVKQAVEKVFAVTVKSVNTLNVLGKIKRTARGIGRKPGYKKAYVTLAEGQSISVVEGL